MRVWLDDIRQPPIGWEWVKTAEEAITALESGAVVEISLDHDLNMDHYLALFERRSPGRGTGYEVAVWIEEAARSGRLARVKTACHSANPAGRKRIEQALHSADRAWRAAEQG